MTATERYARNFARAAYLKDNLDCLGDDDHYQISRIFNRFKPEYHDLIADYPSWIANGANWTPRDKRRAEQCFREGSWPIFLFSHSRIEAYVRQHLWQSQ
jgi:hypothetical protein